MSNIKMIMESVQVVKYKIKIASMENNTMLLAEAIDDLIALYVCLEGEVKKLMK